MLFYFTLSLRVTIGPVAANSFRKMLGMKEAVWEEMKQKTLT
jgi:hypothetical protein